MIETVNLTKRFDTVAALENLSCTIPDGSIFGLIGSNGAGKSTLLRMIAGVFRPDGGTLTLDGAGIFENPDAKAQIAFVPDFPYFFRQATLREMIRLYAGLYPRFDEKLCKDLIKLFRFDTKKRLIQFSKGVQRQAAIILALSTRPRYLLLDEVFDGLDPVMRQLLKRLLADAAADNGCTIVIASHSLRELEDLCDHVGLLHKGGLLLEKELDELRLGIHRIQAAFSPPLEESALAGLNIVHMARTGSLINLVVRGEKEAILNRLRAMNPVLLEALPLTLEEVFISEMEVAGYDIDNII